MNYDLFATKIPHPSKAEKEKHREQLIHEINNTPLTKDQRDAAFRAAADKTAEWAKDQIQLIVEDEARLRLEFEAACEEDNSLANIPPAAKRAVHDFAWQQGGGARRDVHTCYLEVTDLVRQVVGALDAEGGLAFATTVALNDAQMEARIAGEILDAVNIPTNGPEGVGEREELTLSQRVRILAAGRGPMV